MSRHSKHSNDRSFFSYKERVDAGFAGSRKEVLGSDCFLPFGHCSLSLKCPKDPVVTPDGYLYDRECILECLLNQKLELQAQQKKYEEQERRKARKEQAEQQVADLQTIVEFQKADQGLLSQEYRHKRALEKGEAGIYGAPDGPEKKLRPGEAMTINKAEMREKSFWAASSTKTAAPTELKKVDVTSRCPMSGKKLRVKDLIPVKFEVTDQKMVDKGGDKGVFCCAVSKRPITHQQAVLIKPSGQVLLESCVKECGVLKDMKCPVTGIKIKGPEDILKLQMGGTGFSAHNDTAVKVFSHIRSRAGDDRTQAGHLPKAGFCGLH